MLTLVNRDLFTVFFIGVALSMDAFSLGIGLGAQGLRWRDVARLSLVISYFHVLLPLISTWIGDYLHSLYGTVFQQLAAGIMMFMGSKMAIGAVRSSPTAVHVPIEARFPQLVAFAFGVSLDALSTGFTLGTLEVKPLVSALMFGVLSGLFSLLGLGLGRKVNQVLGQYGQLAGGVVLVVLGLKFFW